MIEQEDIDHATGYTIALIIPVISEAVEQKLKEGYTVEQIKLEMREIWKVCLTSDKKSVY